MRRTCHPAREPLRAKYLSGPQERLQRAAGTEALAGILLNFAPTGTAAVSGEHGCGGSTSSLVVEPFVWKIQSETFLVF